MITLLAGAKARAALQRGMKKIHDPVAASMGPAGRNFFYEERDNVQLTKDGASIARWIYGAGLLDRFERAGAALLRRASQKTEEEAGDGTTASTVLAYHMALEAIKHVDEGANVMSIERGMRKAFDAIAKYLPTIKKEAKDRDAWEKIAYISSRDAEVAKVVADAFEKVGPDGWIRVDKGDDWKEHTLTLDLKEGMTFPRGYAHPIALNDPQALRCILKKVPILVTDLKFLDERETQALAAICKACYERGDSAIVIIGQLFAGRVLDFIIQTNDAYNRTARSANPEGMRILPIECPGFGTEFTDEFCGDLAILTGAKLVSEHTGKSLEKVAMEDLGFCEIVECKKKETTIVNSDPKYKEAVELRAAEIKAQYEKAEGELEKRRMQQRLAALTKGSAIITVGGRNVENIGEKTARVEDAVLAAKAAWEDGMVPGAGISLIHAAVHVGLDKPLDPDEALGIEIVWESLQYPLRTIAKNCCMDEKGTVELARDLEETETFNLMRGKAEKVDAFEEGIVDPLKAVLQALLNGIETALTFITTETVGVMIPEDKLRRPIFEVLAGDASDVVKAKAFGASTANDAHPNEIGEEE